MFAAEGGLVGASAAVSEAAANRRKTVVKE
jgi:hypothetical protein